MSSDRIGSNDNTTAALSQIYAAPKVPCLSCGRECAEHSQARRICTHPACQMVQPGCWSPAGRSIPASYTKSQVCSSCDGELVILRAVDNSDHVEVLLGHENPEACQERRILRHYLLATA